MGESRFKYSEMIKNDRILWAHTSKLKDEENLGLLLNKKEPETLKEHMDKVYKYVFELDASNGFLSKIEKIIITIVDTCDFKYKEEATSILMEGFLSAIYMHDMGKISPGYQKGVLLNPEFDDFDVTDIGSEHSPHSSLIYLNEMGLYIASTYPKADSIGYASIHRIVFNFSYSIYTHHSGLGRIEDYATKLKSILYDSASGSIRNLSLMTELQQYNNVFNGLGIFSRFVTIQIDFNKAVENFTENIKSELWILNKLLYSALVTCDTLATAEYMNDAKVEITKTNPDIIMENYKETEIYKNTQKHLKDGIFNGTINAIRCEMFKESEDTLLNNMDKNIFYLEAPTGSGKTNMATNLAFTCISEAAKRLEVTNIDKFVYTAPFNAITTQVAKSLEALFPDKSVVDAVEINSYTPMRVESSDEEVDFNISLLDYQLMNYPLVLTSHVNLFDCLFGISRTDNYSLINLFNSVIIIDEIQAYRASAWRNSIKMFDLYAKYMNIKFIIMSATLPKIDALLKDGEAISSYVNLIEDSSRYFENRFFKSRIKQYDYTMLDREFIYAKGSEEYIEELFEILRDKMADIYAKRSNSKILIEFISKKSARRFYSWIREVGLPCEIMEITGDDNKLYKERVIKCIKESREGILVVATQTIESGVDIDMDFGFKDISYLDSEEQFLGRINRSNRVDNDYSTAYFFDLDDADKIYGKDGDNYKAGFSLRFPKYKRCLEEKDFNEAFKDLLYVLERGIDRANARDSATAFDGSLRKLDFGKVDEYLRLIDKKDNYCKIFLPIKIQIKDEGEHCDSQNEKSHFPDYIISDAHLDGEKVWMRFKECLKIKDYAEKKVCLSEVMCWVGYFSYKIPWYKESALYGEDLSKRGFSYEFIQNIYAIDIVNIDTTQFLDAEYKLDIDKFKEYKANMFV